MMPLWTEASGQYGPNNAWQLPPFESTDASWSIAVFLLRSCLHIFCLFPFYFRFCHVSGQFHSPPGEGKRIEILQRRVCHSLSEQDPWRILCKLMHEEVRVMF